MSALICGSFAFDTIMVFQDQFKNHILPDKVHMLNVSFLVPDMRREFGGCAGNIAYTLNLLGETPKAMGTVGRDFDPYAQWMDHHHIDRTYVMELADNYTAQAYITTDMDDNQITAFHPGAMNRAHEQQVPLDAGITIGLLSPDGRQGMIEHADQFAAANIPFIFDPGQGLPMFGGEELMKFVSQATWVCVNDYESQLLCDRTGLSLEQLAERVKGLIVTRGGNGSIIFHDGGSTEIPAAPINKAIDPTGCGDAYRAGLLYGLEHGLDWATTGRVAALCGAIKVQHHGTQNHAFDLSHFKALFKRNFNYEI